MQLFCLYYSICWENECHPHYVFISVFLLHFYFSRLFLCYMRLQLERVKVRQSLGSWINNNKKKKPMLATNIKQSHIHQHQYLHLSATRQPSHCYLHPRKIQSIWQKCNCLCKIIAYECNYWGIVLKPCSKTHLLYGMFGDIDRAWTY